MTKATTTKTTKTKKVTKKEVEVTPKAENNVYAKSIVKNPRITEKAGILAESACYTFDVSLNATKNEIIKAIKAMYKVTPRKVTTVQVVSKKVMPRGNRKNVGYTSAGKKAYVYLKKGDKIEVL